MDVWENLYNQAKNEYHPQEVSPFIQAHHVVCAIEVEDGKYLPAFALRVQVGLLTCVQKGLQH